MSQYTPPGYPQAQPQPQTQTQAQYAQPQAQTYVVPANYAQPPAPPVAPTQQSQYPQPQPAGYPAAPAMPQGSGNPQWDALQAQIAAASGGATRNPRLPLGIHLVEIVSTGPTDQNPGLIAFDFTCVQPAQGSDAQAGITYGLIQGVAGGKKVGSEKKQYDVMMGYCLALEGFATKEDAAAAGRLATVQQNCTALVMLGRKQPVPPQFAPPVGGPYVGRRVWVQVTPGTYVNDQGVRYNEVKFLPFTG